MASGCRRTPLMWRSVIARRAGLEFAKGRLTDAFFEPLTDDELPPEE